MCLVEQHERLQTRTRNRSARAPAFQPPNHLISHVSQRSLTWPPVLWPARACADPTGWSSSSGQNDTISSALQSSGYGEARIGGHYWNGHYWNGLRLAFYACGLSTILRSPGGATSLWRSGSSHTCSHTCPRALVQEGSAPACPPSSTSAVDSALAALSSTT